MPKHNTNPALKRLLELSRATSNEESCDGLSGMLDGGIVNTADEAPMTVFELNEIAGVPMELVATPPPVRIGELRSRAERTVKEIDKPAR